MRYVKTYNFGPGIKGYCMGWSPAGAPMMTAFFYAFDDILIDTGLAHMGKEALLAAHKQKSSRIFLTHHHEDHSGNAARIREQTGARVYGHSQAAEKLKTAYPIFFYQKYIWGRTTPVAVLPLPRHIDSRLGSMVPVSMPGHSRDHMVYFLPDQGVVFSGDLYLGDRIRYFRKDEDVGAQINSLKKLLEYDFDILLCGHHPKKSRGRDHIKTKLQFLEDLYGGVTALYDKGWRGKEIFRRLGLKEDYFIKAFCCANVSMFNGVLSCIRHYRSEKAS